MAHQGAPTGLYPMPPYPPGGGFHRAGYHLFYRAWQGLGSPVDSGWHVSADELIKLHTNGVESAATRALLIDFDPKAQWRIGIIELLDIYIYTYGYGKEEPNWSPMMLRLRDIFYEEYDPKFDQTKKDAILANLPDPPNSNDFVEFLYLNGPWGWGKNGMTNAAFIHGPLGSTLETSSNSIPLPGDLGVSAWEKRFGITPPSPDRRCGSAPAAPRARYARARPRSFRARWRACGRA